ncbi:hypothetical protein R3P38DRAFT_3495587 [Favolaschia claudopus]|uniref:Uncharacterized protein n=1 Tax=Favolaschia claudopus TaxID=2862362 RepID=A0AAV9Z700_9AGAR
MPPPTLICFKVVLQHASGQSMSSSSFARIRLLAGLTSSAARPSSLSCRITVICTRNWVPHPYGGDRVGGKGVSEGYFLFAAAAHHNRRDVSIPNLPSTDRRGACCCCSVSCRFWLGVRCRGPTLEGPAGGMENGGGGQPSSREERQDGVQYSQAHGYEGTMAGYAPKGFIRRDTREDGCPCAILPHRRAPYRVYHRPRYSLPLPLAPPPLRLHPCSNLRRSTSFSPPLPTSALPTQSRRLSLATNTLPALARTRLIPFVSSQGGTLGLDSWERRLVRKMRDGVQSGGWSIRRRRTDNRRRYGSGWMRRRTRKNVQWVDQEE